MCSCTPRTFSFKFHTQFLRLKLPQINPYLQNPKFVPNSSSKSSNNSLNSNNNQEPTTDSDFLKLKRELKTQDNDEEEEVQIKNSGNAKIEEELKVRRSGKRQLMKRSSLLAKQVISVRTARSLGFVSQLWVDTCSWLVALVEVRPNLLSGEIEKFLLEDVCQVGDVVLVEDEGMIENELRIIGLDILVGYNVVTSGQRSVGKVRGYTFNIITGAVEFLELDPFGVSVIPSSLVSTYCLFVGDVIDVASDTITVQDGAMSRVQRLTKGIWDTQYFDKSAKDIDEYYEYERQRILQRRKGRKSWGQSKTGEKEDHWDIPMDY